MCTTLVRFDPDGAWPLLAGFVRDEDRGRETQPPGFWWPEHPTAFGARDARAGGTWLALDVGSAPGEQGLAFVQNQIGPHVSFPDPASSPSRGQLPIRALAAGAAFSFDAPDLAALVPRFQPFHLVHARPHAARLDWWQWNGVELVHAALQPGMHIVASRGIDLPGERERRAGQLQRFAQAAAPEPDPSLPVREAWGDWIELLDGRDARPDDMGGLVVHSVRERPGFGTVGATLVAIAADGRSRFDWNARPDVAPDAWSRTDVASASVAHR